MLKFPQNFTWGCTTASYQIEGAWLEGGKGLSIWDAFSLTLGKILQGHTGDVACDHYHRYKEDITLMAAMELPAYRFSIAWPLIQSTGYGKPNPEGIRFYVDYYHLDYAQGVFAPGRVSASEPYQAAHQMLRSHGMAVDLYRRKFQHQMGEIGIANNCDWREPETEGEKDRKAAQRTLEFLLNWFADPIY